MVSPDGRERLLAPGLSARSWSPYRIEGVFDLDKYVICELMRVPRVVEREITEELDEAAHCVAVYPEDRCSTQCRARTPERANSFVGNPWVKLREPT